MGFLTSLLLLTASIASAQSYTGGPLQTLSGGKVRSVNTPYTYAISEGEVPDHMHVHATGINPDVDNVEETIWAVGGMYVFPSSTTGTTMELVSSNANDRAGGSGIREVLVEFLDTNFMPSTETVTLNGLTAVPMVSTSIIRIQSMYAVSVGTNGYAVGDVSLRATADTPVYSRIPAGRNARGAMVFTVPAGMTMYVTSITCGCGGAAGGKFGICRLLATADMDGNRTDGIFKIHGSFIVQDGTFHDFYHFPHKLPEKTDVMITVVSDGGTANAICLASGDGWLEMND